MTVDPPQGGHGSENSVDDLSTLVLAAARQARTVQGLLLRVAGEHAEPNRYPRGEGHLTQPLGDPRRHVLEVGGPTSHDDTERHHCVEARCSGPLTRDGQFE